MSIDSLSGNAELVDLESPKKQGFVSRNKVALLVGLLILTTVFVLTTVSLVLKYHEFGKPMETELSTKTFVREGDMTCGTVSGFWYRDTAARRLADVESDSWMNDLKTYIKDTPLSNIKIPATHDSGTYNLTIDKEYSYDTKEDPEMALIPYMASVMKGYGIDSTNVKKFVQPWYKTQECSIYEQLMHGIRHLDFRVCVVPTENQPVNRYWLCHALLGVRVVDALRQVKTFIGRANSKNEIVSIDLNHLYGFSTMSEHYNLLKLISDELGNSTMVDPKQFNVTSTYNKILSGTGRVFVYYTNTDALNTYNTFRIFPGTQLSTQWANVVDMSKLKTALYNQLAARTGNSKGFVTQALLTPNLPFMVDGLFNGVNSVDYLATNNYTVLSEWITSYLQQSKMNYVNTDFYNRHRSFVTSILLANIPNGKLVTQYARYD